MCLSVWGYGCECGGVCYPWCRVGRVSVSVVVWLSVWGISVVEWVVCVGLWWCGGSVVSVAYMAIGLVVWNMAVDVEYVDIRAGVCAVCDYPH